MPEVHCPTPQPHNSPNRIHRAVEADRRHSATPCWLGDGVGGREGLVASSQQIVVASIAG
eukprot:gnl/Chilomastix_caulleri/3522.p3 GENE.gnl/Chilomastix_caulleri/3522~~gnl/Chilomastix_caulleri/3522.p3  ORF type:complete len:60 (+),score=8.70 gnl/Chilomastix_caulleri/3522:266-445(+)